MEETKPRRAPRKKAAGSPAAAPKAKAPAKARAVAKAPAQGAGKAALESPAKQAPVVTERPVLDPELRARMVETAAYYRAERRGFAPGYEVEDWLAAEVEIEALVGGHSGPARSSSAARRKG